MEVHLIFTLNRSISRLVTLNHYYKNGLLTNNKTIKGNLPYFTKLIGFKNDEAFGKAMANAAKKMKS